MRVREKKRIPDWRVIFVLAILLVILGAMPVNAALLNPMEIPKWQNTITGPPPVYLETSKNYYVVNVSQFTQQILPPPLPKTTVYGYGGLTKDAVTGEPRGYIRNSPGPSFDVKKDVPIKVKYINDLTEPHMFAVDPTLMWANPNGMETPVAPFEEFPQGYEEAQSPIPISVHLHGGEVPPTSDGGPDSWWTYDGKHGSEYYTAEANPDPNAAVFEYPNSQQAATLWYHDHALGMTRLNVVGGLAGFYFIRDNKDKVESNLPKDKYEIPLAIQDRVFNTDGTFNFPIDPSDDTVHPYWGPEFFGDTIMVNGLVWPKMNVDQAAYRFRILDGSTARFYNLSLSNGMSFKVIGVEGGYLKSATDVKNILISPGERFDVIVDFSGVAPGTEIILRNSAPTPFPDGDPVNPETTGQIVKFVVGDKKGRPAIKLPDELNPTLIGTFPNLPAPVKERQLVLTEIMGEQDTPIMLLLDGQRYDSGISEDPQQGTTEEWIVANPTADTHPIHLHLVQFQVVKRQQYIATGENSHYEAWLAANAPGDSDGVPPWDGPTVSVDVTPYLFGPVMYPPATEQGWKDTVKMNPGEVTWIRARFASQDGSQFSFDPTGDGKGYYVWHCHIIDHEDNEMMRKYQVT